MNITLRLAWRNLWRHPRRTWLTIGAMVFSNALLVFMISLQFGMYDLMIDNIILASIYTTSIRSSEQGFFKIFQCRIECQDRTRPTPVITYLS